MDQKTGIGRLLAPATEPLEGIATVLREHWRGAARLPGQLFGVVSRPWLRAGLAARVGPPHHLASGGRLIR